MITERQLDERATAATVGLRHGVTRGLDTEDMLDRLRQGARRRRVARGLAAALVAVLALGVAGSVAIHDRSTTGLPATSDGRTPVEGSGTPSAETGVGLCQRSDVECLGDRRLRALTKRPLTFTVPATFWLDPDVTPESVQVVRNDTVRTGVTVWLDAVPVRYDSSWGRDRTAGTSAEEMATWLAGRPFLRDTRVSTRTVAGRTAWTVTGVLRHGAELPAAKPGDRPVAPTFAGERIRTGVAPWLPGAFTLVDQPGGGVTVIWSWTHTRNSQRLAGNVPMVTAFLAG
jgi:hypothetical protein